MSGLLVNFKGGQNFEKVMRHNLGIIEPDVNGDEWSYVQLIEDVGIGDIVADAYGSDILGAASNSVTAAQAIGTRKLKDTGEFATTDKKAFLPGGLGFIAGNAAGEGQAFYIEKVDDDNTLSIVMIASESGIATPGDGWVVALTTDSDYNVILPGVARKTRPLSDTNRRRVRGVAQHSGKKSEYGWVKRTGPGLINVSGSGIAMAHGLHLVVADTASTTGCAETYTTAVDTTNNVIEQRPVDIVGSVIFQDIVDTAVKPVFAEISITENRLKSYRRITADPAFNRQTIQ